MAKLPYETAESVAETLPEAVTASNDNAFFDISNYFNYA